MRYVNLLVLAAVAATVLMAFVGASTASATILCKAEGTGSPTGTSCPANQAYAAGTEIHEVLDPDAHATITTGSSVTEMTFKRRNSEE